MSAFLKYWLQWGCRKALVIRAESSATLHSKIKVRARVLNWNWAPWVDTPLVSLSDATTWVARHFRNTGTLPTALNQALLALQRSGSHQTFKSGFSLSYEWLARGDCSRRLLLLGLRQRQQVHTCASHLGPPLPASCAFSWAYDKVIRTLDPSRGGSLTMQKQQMLGHLSSLKWGSAWASIERKMERVQA